MALATISILVLVAVFAVGGVPSQIFSSNGLGDKSDDFSSQTSTLNENPFFLFNKPALANWGDVHRHHDLQRRGGTHKAPAGIPFFRLTSPQSVEGRYLIPLPGKRGGKVILVDVVDYISKENEEEEDGTGTGMGMGTPAVVVSGKSSGGGGSISGNMMRFSGK